MNQRNDLRYGYVRDREYPDHSEYIWHLTSDRIPLNQDYGFGREHPDRQVDGLGARDRLISILRQTGEPTIWASHLHYMSPNYHNLTQPIRCVCFTECIPFSLHVHAERFSRYGLLFSKAIAYRKGARPVWYLDAALMNRFSQANSPRQRNNQEVLPFPEELLHLLMPFVPEYGDDRISGRTLDFSVEREWRKGADFQFEICDISAIIVPNVNEMNDLKVEVPVLVDSCFIVVQDLASAQIEHRDFDFFFRRHNA